MSYPNKDRSDYRVMTVARLIQEAVDDPNSELAIALGERLSDMEVALDYARETLFRHSLPHEIEEEI
ncbi:MAG: hypothetical protein EBT13_00375 [Rhodobacteraceae bacterium]|nr:hypothetical protein [Paracoccaceae bacterium]